MSDTKLSLADQEILAGELVEKVGSTIIISEDEEIELHEEFAQILDDMFTSRG